MQVLGSILRFLFAWIDGIVAKVITLVYGLLMDLANLTLYSENIVKVIGQRIGILLGIFMLFRLSVSLINYMISPDKFSDSKQGGGALVKNVIISLALLATVNIIFETAYSVQQKVVSSQIIEKIFFGETSQTKMDIGYYLYTGFFTPNPEVIPECNEMWNPTFDLANSQCNLDLGAVVETNALNSIHDARNNLDMSKIFSNYDVVMANKDGAFKGQMVFNYTPIVSTAAGIVTLLIMISFSMELAKRAIKLLFLQIVAPVPIIFNMDTGKGKDVFQKWYKQCFNTYISVFIRLLAIDFAVFIIVLLKGEFSSIFQDKLGVNIFIIIGCLLFAKEVPKLIEDMMGIKLDGMSLRPIKKFQEQALFGKQITSLGAAGLAGGAAMGANLLKRTPDILKNGWMTAEALGGVVAPRSSGRSRWENTKLALKSAGGSLYGIGSIAAGGISATSRGTLGAIKGEKFGQVYNNAYKGAIDARNSRQDRRDDNVGWTEMMGSKITHKLGGSTLNDIAKSANDNLKKLNSNYSSMMAAAEGADDSHVLQGINSLAGQTFKGMKGLAKFEEELKKASINITDFSDITDANGNVITANDQYLEALAEQRRRLDDIDQMKKNRIDEIAMSQFGTSGADAATEKAIKEGYAQIQTLIDEINTATRKIDPDIMMLSKSDNPSKTNGKAKGVTSQLSINETAARAEKIDSYSAKKNQK